MAKWTIDSAHTETGFSVKHMGLSNVKGNFKTTSGTVTTDESGKITKIEVAIEVASIETRIKDRDNHLKSADFFDAEKYPEIKFESTKITSEDGEDYTIEGNLTIKETTKSIRFEAEVGLPIDDPYGLKRNAASLNFAIDRRDYGLIWSQSLANGNLVVGNKIKISAEAEFTLDA
ncbi:YceI family protein [Sporolactobacillus shoreicorticis]|uniref:YceI family protein n=1 Tax=Sporolactobacillus shoreicorticis TaxID=1923877 RepID=A0ABW5S4J7_9BACL|nr:YceI family protein [Sporolactobacillus shoreicorticis]MCO7127360.1 YceI family protein [Sporolactobacillus shoreicorticis]